MRRCTCRIVSQIFLLGRSDPLVARRLRSFDLLAIDLLRYLERVALLTVKFRVRQRLLQCLDLARFHRH